LVILDRMRWMLSNATDAQAYPNLGGPAFLKNLAESFWFSKAKNRRDFNLPELRADPHLHTGYGLRQLHGTHFYEARLDLRWRLIFKVTEEEIVLFDVMNHDQVRRL